MRTRDESKVNLVREKALEMLVIEGFNGFSMQKLAKAAGVSPATLYIYYRDKDDLITQIGVEEGLKMTEAALEGFSSEMSFADGLRLQWKNRASYWMKNPIAVQFFEQIKNSPYHGVVKQTISKEFSEKMSGFVANAQRNNEVITLSLPVYWSVAFAPLYNLLYFHTAGRALGHIPFTLTDEILDQTLELVIKALSPNKLLSLSLIIWLTFSFCFHQ
ncbi:DNA-binding transcriptional regulator, AcrR family [Flexibacter flexilis DSM 6793]|uniref:DNA-binding transcriptional regulator, AcrR family n=1 Tax=Flexibacter flexilis DSM 6793 TaxID=927664 RepID=A0A1I1FRS3_9BACT|nr:TetR/AcrR family transcriptional regulator [Flexibacter flexilis]SFC02137.1 DNA-binding transcriptional regulator, AcrR family [Flexibacter flexilis DSM 6793]